MSCSLGKARPGAPPALRRLPPEVLVTTEESGRPPLTPNRPLRPPRCQAPEASSAPANPDRSPGWGRRCSPVGLERSSLGGRPLPRPGALRLRYLLTAVTVLGLFVNCPPPRRSSMTFRGQRPRWVTAQTPAPRPVPGTWQVLRTHLLSAWKTLSHAAM